MDKKLAVTILGVSVLALAGVFGFRHMTADAPRQGATGKVLESANIDEAGESNSDGYSRTKAPAGREGTLLGSARAVDILSKNETSFAGPGERTYVRMQIATLCDDALIRNPPLGAAKSADSTSSADVRREFCQGSTVAMEQEQTRLAELPANDPYVAAYGMASELFDSGQPNGVGTKGVETITPVLGSIMLSERAGFEAVVAAEALQQVGYVDPRVQGMARKAGWSLSQEQLAQAQVLATQIRACGRYGGCGPSQLQTMQACAQVGKCGATDTAESIWRRTHSPAIYEAAQTIAKFRS
jgi:hypothetical protein